MSIGGSATDPKGCVGGIGLGNGVQYAVNATAFEASFILEVLEQTQDIRTLGAGVEVLVVDSANNGVLASLDAGAAFAGYKVTSPVPEGSTARYASIAGSGIWYVSFGSWTGERRRTPTEVPLSERISMIYDSQGVWRRRAKKTSNPSKNHTGYSAAIAKTTDYGGTWLTVFSSEDDFYFNGIDCVDTSHCVAVGEGFNANAGIRVYHTSDGIAFTEVFRLNSTITQKYSVVSVRYATEHDVWAAGAVEGIFTSSALFITSKDGGRSWAVESTTLQNVSEITYLSFTPEGIGFATAIAGLEDCTILRYDPRGPPPSTPAPTPKGFFIQEQCNDTRCSQQCQNTTFPTLECLQVTGGGSAVVECRPGELVEKIYSAANCTGSFTSGSMPLNLCLQDSQGSSFENFCPAPPGIVHGRKLKRPL
jgi:hypothetical protein